ncbi:protein brambleberry-like [Lutzomyia longipalpis]|nr:protein brambleberry-like [Lutzomyia longipalpis]
MRYFLYFLLIVSFLNAVNTQGVLEYITELIWSKPQYSESAVHRQERQEPLEENVPKILYEVTPHETIFLEEALALSGAKTITNLDRCQHRVVLKLRKNCGKMNEEELGKLSIMLLNCHRLIEGQNLLECSETMTLRDCTALLDSAEIYNSYQLMFTRAKAICIVVGQLQYRAWAESAVNKLSSYAQEQLKISDQLVEEQKNLNDAIDSSNQRIIENEKEILRFIDHIRIKYMTSIKEVSLKSTMLQEVQVQKFENILIEFNKLSTRISNVETTLEADLKELHENSGKITKDIIAVNTNLLQQIQQVSTQYRENLNTLEEIQTVIEGLFVIINQWKDDIGRNGKWIEDNLGEISIYKIMYHIGFLFMGMIILSFIQVDGLSRILFVSITIGNALCDVYSEMGMSLPALLSTLVCIIGGKYLAMHISWNKFLQGFGDTTTEEEHKIPSTRQYQRDSPTTSSRSSTHKERQFTCTAVNSQGSLCQNSTFENSLFCQIHSLRQRYDR